MAVHIDDLIADELSRCYPRLPASEAVGLLVAERVARDAARWLGERGGTFDVEDVARQMRRIDRGA